VPDEQDDDADDHGYDHDHHDHGHGGEGPSPSTATQDDVRRLLRDRPSPLPPPPVRREARAEPPPPTGSVPPATAFREPVGAYARDVLLGDLGIGAALRGDRGKAEVTTTRPSAPAVRFSRGGRLTIDRVQLVSAALGITVTVSLGHDGDTLVGEAEGAATQTGVQRSVARATLRAVEQVAGKDARFEVEHVEVTKTGPDQVVMVVVSIVTGRSTQRLSGAAVVREDVRQAVIRAVLAAVNRRLEPMLEGE
jgi:hypothetical protein